MDEISLIRTVTEKGQVTIPAQIRRALGLEANSRVVFAVRDGQVLLTAARETLHSAFGAVPPLSRPEDFQALRDQAIRDKAEDTAAEMNAAHDVP